jgi:1,2-alpha-glucosylglycerol phosphorylase
MQLRENLITETCWEIIENSFDPSAVTTDGSIFLVANGYYGYRGTHADWGADSQVGFLVTDTYDKADEKWKELCNVPNPLYVQMRDATGPLSCLTEPPHSYRRELNFRYSRHRMEASWKREGGLVTVHEERVALRGFLHGIVQKTVVSADHDCSVELCCGIDTEVWSLNGNHFAQCEPSVAEAQGSGARVDLLTVESELPIVVGHRVFVDGHEVTPKVTADSKVGVRHESVLHLRPGETREITIFAAVYSANDFASNSASDSANELQQAGNVNGLLERGALQQQLDESLGAMVEHGYGKLIDDSCALWDQIWADCDIRVTGDSVAQTLLRYNLYHNIIATPMHSERLPIGARGLSCQAYQGAAFWDQEIFNMPMFLYTRPEIARNILLYRYHTLDGARAKARDLGYKGAFYAWISGKDGHEICPSYFFVDVLSGRAIRNHFNDWQIHISPDIAYAVFLYLDATDDWEFMSRYGAEIVFEVARFLQSFVYYKPEKRRYELIRLLGPDEYHENVDNNFFTAFQSQFVLGRAVSLFDELQRKDPDRSAILRRELGISELDRDFWQDVSERLQVQKPRSSAVIEQFDGFFRLEDITPRELEQRIVDPAEYWGWPNGVAVETQVSKQADICQTFVLHKDAYSTEIMNANYNYYEPRTQHGSSLSPPVYSMVASWVGQHRAAYDYFIRAAGVDLFGTGKAFSGGTFIGGIHTAACGASWQVVVSGFAGMRHTGETLVFTPRLPEGWSELEFSIRFHGDQVGVKLTQRVARFLAYEDNETALHIECAGQELSLSPGIELVVELPPATATPTHSERKR